MKKILAFMLSVFITVSSFTGVEAREISSTFSDLQEGTEAVAETLATSSETVTDNVSELQPVINIYNSKNKSVKVMSPFYYSTSSQVMDGAFNQYKITVSEGYEKNVVVPVKVKTKGLLMLVAVDNAGSEIKLKSIYSDAACKNKIVVSKNLARINKSGTYYISIDKSQIEKEGYSIFRTALGFISGDNATLTNKSEVLRTTFGVKSPLYYKIKVTRTKKLTLTVTSEKTGTACLCSGKKSAVTHETSTAKNGGKFVYVLKKGTYYFKLKLPKGVVSVASVFSNVTNSSGTSKAKAGAIKVNGSSKKALIFAGDSTKKAYYLKFYNPKKQKIYMTMTSSYCSGKLKFAFSDTKKTNFGSAKSVPIGVDQKRIFETYIGNGRTLPKGTYYIKIKKTDKKTSGYVQISVKNKK